MFPIGIGMVELRSAFANDMPNLRAAGFPPPPGYCSGAMQGALHASAMGHHPDASSMSAATATGAASFFPHHLGPPGSLRHHANHLMTTHNHNSGSAGPFGILPHEAVNLMNSGAGGHHHPPGSLMSTHHATSSSGYPNKSCSIESNKYYHHHHKNSTNGSSSFGGMMSSMPQNVYTGAARSSGRSSFDHQLSKQLAHHHASHAHQTPDPYFSNFLMSTDNYAASQYAAAAAAANMRVASNQHMLGISNSSSVSSRATSHSHYSAMNFPNSLARDFIGFGSNSHSFKHGSNSSCHNQTRNNVNSAITGNNHLSSCNMMMTGLTPNSYHSNSSIVGNNSAPPVATNHGSTSRSSSVASNHHQQGSESSSCSYGYSSPSTNVPHSPYQKRSSVSTTSAVVPSQTPTTSSNVSVASGVQDFTGNTYTNQASGPPYSSLGTPVGLSSSAYPTPPSSVNQQIPSQPGVNQTGGQDDSMRHFHVNSQNTGQTPYPSNFNSSPYPAPKLSNSNGSSSSSIISNSSCMVAAAAAAAASSSASNSSGGSENYIHGNLSSSGSGLREASADTCLSNLVNVTPISDAMSNSSKVNESQLNSSASVEVNVMGSEHNLNSVFTGSDIEFPGLSFPMVEASAAASYAQSMRIDGSSALKKKKEKSKKHKRKEKNKALDRISNNSFALFPFQQTDSHYHEGFSDPMSQSCNTFTHHTHSHHHHQHHHQDSVQAQTPVQTSLYAKSSNASYNEPSSSANQQLQVPSSQVPSVPQPPPPSSQPTGPSHLAPSSHSESQTSQLQSQSNLLAQNELVPRTSPCFDTSSIHLQSDLLNNSLGDQISSSGSQHAPTHAANSSLDYGKSHQDSNASQSIVVRSSETNAASMAQNENDSQMCEKFTTLEDDLNFLTTATGCETTQVQRNEMGTQAGPQIPPESHDLSLEQHPQQQNQQQHQPQQQHHSQQPDQPISSSLACVDRNTVDSSLLTNSCATLENQVGIKSSATSSGKKFPPEYISETSNSKVPPVAGAVSAIDVNNCENKINDTGTVKKKKKPKDSKNKLTTQQKSSEEHSPCNKRSDSRIESSPTINVAFANEDKFKKTPSNTVSKSVTACKPMEVTNAKKPGDMRDHEAKFFKMRPVTNTTTITSLNSIQSTIKPNFKSNKKRKIEEPNEKSPHDEYEFPDSPTNSVPTKKVKRINSENSKKKALDKMTPNNNCPLINNNKKLSVSSKVKANNFGNTALSKLNLNEKSEHPKIAPRPSNQQINGNKVKTEENRLVKNAVPLDKRQQYGSNNQQQRQRTSKDSHKQPTMIVQEILAPIVSSPCPKNNINIVSINKKPVASGPNQIKKDPTPCTSINSNTVQASTLTTIVPLAAGSFNSPIIISNTATTLSTISQSNQQQQQQQQQPQSQPQTQSQPQSIKTSTQSVSMQSAGTNTPRRRSQDKKTLTIREGLMRTGDFVVSLAEVDSELPMIWRIEGKSLLQRFEPSEQDGTIVYTNTSSYSAWNPTVKQRYTGVDVRIMGCNRTKIVVEKLGLTKATANEDKSDHEKGQAVPNSSNNMVSQNGEAVLEKSKTNDDKPSSNNFQHRADFEVFIQTLISQALDPNFISEIIKENDEYFLSHLHAIDDYCILKKSRFFSKVKWDAHIVKCVETFPNFTVIPQIPFGDLRCRLCHDNWSTQILHFTGKTYDPTTLETKDPVVIKQTKYAACDECKEKVKLFSQLHHQKHIFFTKCRDKVEEMRGGVEDKDSPMILEECLKDTDWMQSLFKKFEEIWQSCDRIR